MPAGRGPWRSGHPGARPRPFKDHPCTAASSHCRAGGGGGGGLAGRRRHEHHLSGSILAEDFLADSPSDLPGVLQGKEGHYSTTTRFSNLVPRGLEIVT